MKCNRSAFARKAILVALGLCILLTALLPVQATSLSPVEQKDANDNIPTISDVQKEKSDAQKTDVVDELRSDQVAEAARAYKQAMSTLSTLTALPPSQTFDTVIVASGFSVRSVLGAFLPNIHGQGPVGSAARIVLKLYNNAVRRLSGGVVKDRLGAASKKREEELRGKAIKVVDLLQHSAELGNTDALYTLAQVSLFPPTRHFRSDPHAAFEALSTHAIQTGNASSQALLAFFYSTGYRGVVSIDQAKAQLYYTFAANGGDKGAEMALGYRYWSGIGTQDNCERAALWYQSAGEQTIAKFLSGPPGGRTLPQTPTRLSDLVGGIYGFGASVASTGLNAQRPAIKAGLARNAGETWEDVLEYYLFNADRGEIDFAYQLGKIFYQGSIYSSLGGIASGSEGVGAIPRNYAYARHYFLLVARQVWPRDPANPLQYQSTPVKDERAPAGYAAAAAAYLGRMYLRGEGVKADPAVAKMWFQRGAEHGDRECHNGLGIIYRDALIRGTKPDMKSALAHFSAAAGQELAEAQVNLGKYHYERRELALATTYFESAVRHGSPLEAYYYLGDISAAQISTSNPVSSSTCAMAVSFYKLISERGAWDNDLLREAEYAWLTGTDHGREVAILKWWMAAERGFEIAQNNLAYILDQDESVPRLTRSTPLTPDNATAHLALTQWTRAASQRNIDALVKVGDYYYYGLGVGNETETSRYEKAARYYQSAADTQLSALAMWNLGWMYENGIGVPQDFHLAKRHYDLVLETNPEAYMPVLISLARLYLRSIWHTLRGGKDGLTLWGNGDLDDNADQSGNQKEEAERGWQKENGKDYSVDSGQDSSDGEEGPWYFGKAKEDFRKRRALQGMRDHRREEEDPIQWARDRRNAEQDRDSDSGPEDYFDAALRGGNREVEGVDEFKETMLLVLLCLVISILIYIRGRIIDRMRRDQQGRQQGADRQENQAQGNGGLFPPPEDPARNDWAILR